ncbi:MAG: UbiA family prenyltransferase [Candidatus Competibacteraceae bacterium]|nr:UbiA family prenyltransferase [Candidatus Competibacteraceae bacterium]
MSDSILPPLCVDLDGTLINTDLLVESFFLLLGKHPLLVLFVPFWLLRGKARLKQELARRVEPDAATLPYHPAFLTWLRQQHAQGRRLVLATSAAESFARQIADHLGIFSQIIATTDDVNLSGSRKAERLCERFDERGFDYAGNGMVDVAVWGRARQAILVNPARGVREQAARVAAITAVFDDREGARPTPWFKALRVHQWLKNVLVFVPLLAAHRIDEVALLFQAVLAYVAFGLCASSVYLLNDLLDLPADRQHPRKRLRPFAAGQLPVLAGAWLVPALLVLAFLLAGITLPPLFSSVLLGYYALALTYSLYFKQIVMLDAVVLAALYTLRIIAGATATGIVPTFWLLAFSMFIFLSLALVKRHAELLALREMRHGMAWGRGYQVDDLQLLQTLGGASGYLSVLVLALYINSSTSQVLYRHPEAIWLLCPLLLYWISRVWLKTHRGEMHDDPVIFAVQDRVSQVLMGIGAAIVWLAL